MREISKDVETADFEKPDSVVEVDIVKGSNPPAIPSGNTSSDNIVTELFVKGTEPTNVSEEVDELDSVSNLSATYNADNERSEEHTSELQSRGQLVCRLLLEKK